MKKSVVTLMLVVMFALSACGGSAAETQAVVEQPAEVSEPTATEVVEPTEVVEEVTEESTEDTSEDISSSEETSSDSSTGLVDTYDNAIPVAYQLLLGTLELQSDTTLALTADQATTLQPLWISYQSLTMSSMGGGMPGGQPADMATPDPDVTPEAMPTMEEGAAPADMGAAQTPAVDEETQAEIDDLLTQIEAVYTADQIAAIADMQITSDQVQTMMDDLGITTDAGQDGAQPGGAPQDGGAAPADMTPVDGTPAAGDGSAPTGGPQMGDGAGTMIQPAVLNAVIQYLSSLSGIAIETPTVAQ